MKSFTLFLLLATYRCRRTDTIMYIILTTTSFCYLTGLTWENVCRIFIDESLLSMMLFLPIAIRYILNLYIHIHKVICVELEFLQKNKQ